LVDDGSTDNTAEVAGKYPVRVIRQPNAGPASARNTGVRNASGEIAAFTDADCIPRPEWLSTLVHPFHDPQVIGVKGAYRTRQTGRIPRFVQIEYQYKYQRMRNLTSIDFIDTYSAAYRRDVFLANGGFNESYRVPSVEDQEFSFRLARKGYHLVFEPGAIVDHQHDGNLSEYIRRKFGIGYWKSLLLHSIPEKTFSDSHTSPSQRFQIALAGLLCAFLPTAFIWPTYAIAGIVATLGLFLLTCISFLLYVVKTDPAVVWISPGMLLTRAFCLGAGLLVGFISPPAKRNQGSLFISIPARIVKRLIDILGSLVGIVFTAPVLAFAATAITLDSPGPAFFRQERAGENGKPFTILKLRTMFVGSDHDPNKDIPPGQLPALVCKKPHDPRVTRVGRFLRRWSLDELPQFLNVLRGEMSLVGPRPEEVWIVSQYNDFQRQRLLAKPGMTGPMQIHGRGNLDLNQRVELELDYLRRYSIAQDLIILTKTFYAVFTGKGAY
jgi:lipopolysaccharide/colanic/teichoic acid biosynthesis glycosyltransferase/GT2 family glycosyltransferase